MLPFRTSNYTANYFSMPPSAQRWPPLPAAHRAKCKMQKRLRGALGLELRRGTASPRGALHNARRSPALCRRVRAPADGTEAVALCRPS